MDRNRQLNQEIFEKMMKGHILSLNSIKDKEYISYLKTGDNLEKLNNILKELGYRIIGENNYYFLEKINLSAKEKEEFLKYHKKKLLAVLLLRKTLIYLRPGNKITKDMFIENLDLEREKKTIRLLFDNIGINYDKIDVANRLFNLLSKQDHIIEKRRNKNEYIVLNAIDYYFNIVEKMNVEDEETDKENKNENNKKGEQHEKNLLF